MKAEKIQGQIRAEREKLAKVEAEKKKVCERRADLEAKRAAIAEAAKDGDSGAEAELESIHGECWKMERAAQDFDLSIQLKNDRLVDLQAKLAAAEYDKLLADREMAAQLYVNAAGKVEAAWGTFEQILREYDAARNAFADKNWRLGAGDQFRVKGRAANWIYARLAKIWRADFPGANKSYWQISLQEMVEGDMAPTSPLPRAVGE